MRWIIALIAFFSMAMMPGGITPKKIYRHDHYIPLETEYTQTFEGNYFTGHQIQIDQRQLIGIGTIINGVVDVPRKIHFGLYRDGEPLQLFWRSKEFEISCPQKPASEIQQCQKEFPITPAALYPGKYWLVGVWDQFIPWAVDSTELITWKFMPAKSTDMPEHLSQLLTVQLPPPCYYAITKDL